MSEQRWLFQSAINFILTRNFQKPFDRLFEVCNRLVYGLALARNIKLRTKRNISAVFRTQNCAEMQSLHNFSCWFAVEDSVLTRHFARFFFASIDFAPFK
jgi:hypothetical protein